MSNEWDSAFGETKGLGDAPAAGSPSSTAAHAADDFSRAFGSGKHAAEPRTSRSPREVGLLSDETRDALKMEARDSAMRLAGSLRKGVANSASVATHLTGQGASIGRAILGWWKRERIGRRCWITCGAIAALAAMASVCIEVYARRASPVVGGPEATRSAQETMSKSAVPPTATVVPKPPKRSSKSEHAPHPIRTASRPSMAALPAQISSGTTKSLDVAEDIQEAPKHRSQANKNRAIPKDRWVEHANTKLDAWFRARTKRTAVARPDDP